MRVLFDTVAFVRSVDTPEALPKRVRALLDDEDSLIELSSISFLELGIKSAKNLAPMSMEQARQYVEDLKFRILPYLAEHAAPLFSMPLHHRDPFDRVLIGQAIAEGIPIVSPDNHFPKYKGSGLEVIWN